MMIRELTPEDTHLAYEAMLELRPGIGSIRELTAHVNGTQRPEGYRLIAAFQDGEEQALAVAGFRVMHHLAWGRTLYCDDLSSRAAFRRRGLGRQLLEWLISEARRLGCDSFHLDSGVGADRQDAHRLYLNVGMRISAHHFQLEP